MDTEKNITLLEACRLMRKYVGRFVTEGEREQYFADKKQWERAMLSAVESGEMLK